MSVKKILVLCTGNSCRSQIAEGYLIHFAKDKANVYSAGIEAHGVDPRAIAIMKEDGIDISHQTSNNVDEYKEINFDLIITVCDNAKEHCPHLTSSGKRFHHSFPDPSKYVGTDEDIKKEFALTRELLKNYCKRFVEENLV